MVNTIFNLFPLLREFSMKFYLVSPGYFPIFKYLTKKNSVEEKSIESS